MMIFICFGSRLSISGGYKDTAVNNNTTYYYKVCGVVAGVEGAYSNVASALPSTNQPTLTITSAQVTDGVLHVYFARTGGWTPETAALLIDDEPVDMLDPSYEALHFAYQTTESINGTHKVTIEMCAGIDPVKVVAASTSVLFNNDLSCFTAVNAGDDSSSNEVVYVYGSWATARPWTITITDAYDNPIRIITGNSRVVDYAWDGLDQSGSPTFTYTRYHVRLSTTQSSGGTATGKMAVYRIPRRTGPPYYLAFYPSEDSTTPGFPIAFRNRCLLATNQLKFRFQSVTNSQNPWAVSSDGWDYPMLGDYDFGSWFLDMARILHYTGHGSPTSISSCYDDSWWYGYSALSDYTNGLDIDYIGLGDRFANWFRGRCRVTGRIVDIDIPIRYRMVFLDGCRTGDVARASHLYWPFVFGIAHPGPTGTRVSKGSAYLGWVRAGYPFDTIQSNFIDYFWTNLVTHSWTLGESVDRACTASGLPRSHIRVVGDRNMRL